MPTALLRLVIKLTQWTKKVSSSVIWHWKHTTNQIIFSAIFVTTKYFIFKSDRFVTAILLTIYSLNSRRSPYFSRPPAYGRHIFKKHDVVIWCLCIFFYAFFHALEYLNNSTHFRQWPDEGFYGFKRPRQQHHFYFIFILSIATASTQCCWHMFIWVFCLQTC